MSHQFSRSPTPLHRIYYDATMEFGSEGPSDPEKTTRILPLMLAEDY
jgi:Protein of unknown function (DUF3768)